jgi:hypothetical protein
MIKKYALLITLFLFSVTLHAMIENSKDTVNESYEERFENGDSIWVNYNAVKKQFCGVKYGNNISQVFPAGSTPVWLEGIAFLTPDEAEKKFYELKKIMKKN